MIVYDTMKPGTIHDQLLTAGDVICSQSREAHVYETEVIFIFTQPAASIETH